MKSISFWHLLAGLLLLVLIPAAVSAEFVGQNGTITLTFRGADSFTIGDTVYLDGTSTVSPNLMLKMTGPGLPADGVPLDDPAGIAGSGSVVNVRNDSKWGFPWYTSTLANTNVQTARYTIYAVDLNYPTVITKSSVMIRKPYLVATVAPNPVARQDSVTISGSTTYPVDQVRIDIVRVPQLQERSTLGFDVPLSADGTFSKQFHADLPEGNYDITITTPGNTLTTKLQLAVGLTTVPVATAETTPAVVTTAEPTTAAPVVTTATAAATATATPAPASSAIDTNTLIYVIIVLVAIIIIIGVILVIRSRRGAAEAEEEESEEEESEE